MLGTAARAGDRKAGEGDRRARGVERWVGRLRVWIEG